MVVNREKFSICQINFTSPLTKVDGDFLLYLTMEKDKELYRNRKLFRKTSRIKECFFHKQEDCKGDIKQSHSIQKNGRLSILENDIDSNKMLYTLTEYSSSTEHLMSDLIPIGKKEASTFFGFCDKHDTELFSPIENFKFDNSDKHCFLHSYRSFAHSYHRKKESLKAMTEPNNQYLKIPNDIKSTFSDNLKAALNEMEEHKKALSFAIENKQYQSLDYLVYEKEGLYPFAVSSIISPKTSYRNKPMIYYNGNNPVFPYQMLTFLPDKTSTFIILAAFPEDQKSIHFLNELEHLPDYLLEKVITSLIITNCENTFFSPKIWDSLNNSEKRKLLDEFTKSILDNTYKNRFFMSSFNFFDERFEFKNL